MHISALFIISISKKEKKKKGNALSDVPVGAQTRIVQTRPRLSPHFFSTLADSRRKRNRRPAASRTAAPKVLKWIGPGSRKWSVCGLRSPSPSTTRRGRSPLPPPLEARGAGASASVVRRRQSTVPRCPSPRRGSL